jgi:Raf kinase inhibitor-like YbhB/YbcL family protein
MRLFMLTAIAAIVLAGFLAEGSSSDSLKNLTVSYGFIQFPKEYACDGMDVSPRIEISGLRGASNVTSIAIILDDPDAPIGTFTHWVTWNLIPANVIPGKIPNLMNITAPIKAIQGTNSAGKIGYMGPCPPPGKPHRYFLKVYGLDMMLDLKPGSNKSALENAMNGHVLLQGEATATYGR